MSDKFTCEICGDTFDTAWSDEEAMAEARAEFTTMLGDNPAVVCDDCYRALTCHSRRKIR